MVPSGDEIVQVIYRGFESKDLDYKSPMVWDEGDKHASCALVKDIIGMANTLGGYIVIGVSEKGEGFSWDGLTSEQISSFESSRVNRYLRNYADPPINVILRKQLHEGRNYVVISVPRFADTPHICCKTFPGVLTAPTLYVRTASNETAPLAAPSDFQALIEQAIRNRSERLLASFRAILTATETSYGQSSDDRFRAQVDESLEKFTTLDPYRGYEGYRESIAYPSTFESQRFSLDILHRACSNASVDFRGWPFLFVGNRAEHTYSILDGLETFVARKDFGGNDCLDFWRLQQSGFFFQRVLMWEESYSRARGFPNFVDADAIVRYVTEGLLCMTRLYDSLLEESEDLLITFGVLGTQDRRLYTPLGHDIDHHIERGLCRIPEIRIAYNRRYADWRAGMIEHAAGIVKEIFARFNWQDPDKDMLHKWVQKALKRGSD